MNVKLSAQRLAAKGFHVFPIYGKGIKPHNWNGREEADGKPKAGWHDSNLYQPSSTSLEDISEWPDTYKGQTISGYGVNPKGRAVIIDVDNYDKDSQKRHDLGSESLSLLSKAYNLDLSGAFRVTSKSPGSYHLYFAYPDHLPYGCFIKSPISPTISLPDGSELKLNHVDIRADRAHVVGPTADGPYRIAPDCAISSLDNLATLPQNLVDQFVAYANNSMLKPAEDDSGDIPAGARNDYMFRLFCKLKGKGLPLNMAEAIVKSEYSRLEQPKSNKIPLEEFLSRLGDIYQSDEYSANALDIKMGEYLENLIHVKAPHVIFDLRTMDDCKVEAAKSVYSHFIKFDSVTPSGESKTIELEIFSKWLKNNDRIKVDAVGFNPNYGPVYTSDTGTGRVRRLVNKYVRPKWSPVQFNTETKSVRAFQDLAEYVWEDDVDYAMKWCSSIIQRPHDKIQHMLMLVSTLHGLGKDAFFKGISTVIGTHNTRIIQMENLEEKFNSYMQDNLLILINESNKISDSKVDSVRSKLKMYVTADDVPIRRMGTDVQMHKTFSNFMLFGNNTRIMNIEDEDNRIFPHISKRTVPAPDSLIDTFFNLVNTDDFGNEVFSYMMSYDLAGFNAKKRAPKSQDREQMIYDNKSSIEKRIIDAIKEEIGIFRFDLLTKDTFEFMINEMSNHSFCRAEKTAFMDNLWLAFSKSFIRLKQVRIQRIKLRKHANEQIMVEKTPYPTYVFAIRNAGHYGDGVDTAFVRRTLYNGLLELTDDIRNAVNLKPDTLKILNDLTGTHN